MSTLHHFPDGGFHFLEGGFPYSAGVIASPGNRLVRARFSRELPVSEGFARIAEHLRMAGRPLTALCAAELRSPRPFTFAGFHEFNQGYVKVLEQWGLVRAGLNPVARSNVCPVFTAPTEPVFHAFTYTVTAAAHRATAPRSGTDFVVAGSGEWPEGQPFPQAIIARGDLSAKGLEAKVAYVLQTMQERCEGLGGDWARLSAAQIYTAENFHPLLGTQFARAGLLPNGLSWHVCKPPILELEFEMDVRSVCEELVL